jgi:hypothetical protein
MGYCGALSMVSFADMGSRCPNAMFCLPSGKTDRWTKGRYGSDWDWSRALSLVS